MSTLFYLAASLIQKEHCTFNTLIFSFTLSLSSTPPLFIPVDIYKTCLVFSLTTLGIICAVILNHRHFEAYRGLHDVYVFMTNEGKEPIWICLSRNIYTSFIFSK